MKQRNFQPKQAAKGFTLVEMLGVILIIAVFLGMGVNMIKDMDQGKSLSSAVAIAEGIFDEARIKAISSTGASRLVVHNDPSEPERFRRYLAVAEYGNVADDGTFVPSNPNSDGGDWIVTASGTLLPRSSYFDINGSGLVGANLAPGLFSIELPGENRAPVSCFFYEFNGEGIITSPGPGAGFVVAKGSLPPQASEPTFELNEGVPADAGGFVIWRLGNSSRIQNTSQINY